MPDPTPTLLWRKRLVVRILCIVFIAIGTLMIFWPTIIGPKLRWHKRLQIAKNYLPTATQKTKEDNRFAKIDFSLYVNPRLVDFSLLGEVETEIDFNALQKTIDSIKPPLEVSWRVEIKSTGQITNQVTFSQAAMVFRHKPYFP